MELERVNLAVESVAFLIQTLKSASVSQTPANADQALAFTLVLVELLLGLIQKTFRHHVNLQRQSIAFTYLKWSKKKHSSIEM